MTTKKGYLDQEVKNLLSNQLVKDMKININFQPSQELDNIKSNDIICNIINYTKLSKSYSDQICSFPVHSSRGNEYIFMFYHFDTNSIHSIPI